MSPTSEIYKDHEIVVPDAAAAAAPGPAGAAVRAQPPVADLLVDGEPIRYGRLPDGQFFLQEYAYDWSADLAELARRLIDHRDRARAARRSQEPGAGD